MKTELTKIYQRAKEDIAKADSTKSLQDALVRYLGRKARLIQLLREVKNLPFEERRSLGQLANDIRQKIEQLFREKRKLLVNSTQAEQLDLTLPSLKTEAGHFHPLTLFLRRTIGMFQSMGFEVVDGPEVETARYNFDLLNIPRDHPARDLWDTFYVEQPKSAQADHIADPGEELLLRTHTSSVQLRAMLGKRPPVRLIAPGRVFRHEATDASHECTFYQCEGLVIDQGIRVTDLIGTLSEFLKIIFGPDVKIRVRPEYYPFVEPGLDIDISCILCRGKGCSVCKQRGWLEMLGSGMVHPAVLKNMKIDPQRYSGFAFGLGIDRLMMLFYGINDIRLSYSHDFRFLKQFT